MLAMSSVRLLPASQKRLVVCVLACLMLAISCLCLTGCYGEQQKDMESKERAVLAYYNGKYNTNASIDKAHMCMTESGTLGSTPTYDYYYEMSDGSTVMYLAETGSFVDDGQYDEINTAILNEVWNPRMEALQSSINPENLTMIGLAIGTHKSGSYVGKGYATYYNGNIKEFMQEEPPTVTFQKVAMLSNNPGDEEQLRQFFVWVNENFAPKPECEVICGSPDFADQYGRPRYDESYCEISVGPLGVRVMKPKFITFMDGVKITAEEYDFQLQEGDITVEEVPIAELQAKIDEAYNALPYKSEKNSGGNYKEHDQVNENHDTLLEGTAYKIHFSDRLKAAIDKYGLSCRVRFSDEVAESGYYLFEYMYNKTGFTTSGSVMCRPESQMDYNSLVDDEYLFLGKIERGKAEGETKIMG